MVVEFFTYFTVMKLSDQGKHVSATGLESHPEVGYLPDKDGDAFESIRK